MKSIDLTNKRYDRLIVLGKAGRKGEKVMWKCQCDCGNIVYVQTCNLNAHRVKSCGCLKDEKLIERSTKHNQRHTKLYEVWKSMKQRCSNPNNKAYKNYGGRGIKVCDEWKNDFFPFYQWSMQNGYKDTLTIDRINVNGNYEPSNCRWVDRETQANNTRVNHYITFNNKTLTITQWARLMKVNKNLLYNRFKKGWSIEKALTTPPKH